MVFLSSDVTEPTLLTALFATMIVLCYYLYLLSLRTSLLIPIIKSNEKNCFCIKKIKLRDNNNNVPFPCSSNNCIHYSKDKKAGKLNPTKIQINKSAVCQHNSSGKKWGGSYWKMFVIFVVSRIPLFWNNRNWWQFDRWNIKNNARYKR